MWRAATQAGVRLIHLIQTAAATRTQPPRAIWRVLYAAGVGVIAEYGQYLVGLNVVSDDFAAGDAIVAVMRPMNALLIATLDRTRQSEQDNNGGDARTK